MKTEVLGEYVGVRDAAERVGVAYPTLYAAIKRGTVGATVVGRHWVMSRTQVEDAKRYYALRRGLAEFMR